MNARSILPFVFAAFTSAMWATEQMPDLVRLEGREYELSFQIRSNTLSIYGCEDPKVPHLFPPHTACYRGYVGVWDIRDQRLLLIGLRETCDEKGNAQTNRFAELFPGHPTGIVASWFTGLLRLNEPKCDGFMTAGRDMMFSKELHADVLEGRVRTWRRVDNSEVVRDAISKAMERMREDMARRRQNAQQPFSPANAGRARRISPDASGPAWLR